MQLAGNLSPQERALLQHRPLAKLFLKWVWFCIESTNIFVRELFDHANQRKFSPTEISRYTVIPSFVQSDMVEETGPLSCSRSGCST